MSENPIKRITRFIEQNKELFLRTAHIFLFWVALMFFVIFEFCVLSISIFYIVFGVIAPEAVCFYISSVILVNAIIFFLELPVLLLVSRLACYVRVYRFFQKAAFFVALCLPLLLIYHAIILMTDREWHIGEETCANVSDSVLLVDITKRMGYSGRLPIERIATFSQINGKSRLTELRMNEGALTNYLDFNSIYLFHKTSILEDMCRFGELKTLKISGYSHLFSPFSLGQVPKELIQLKELKTLWIFSSNAYKIPCDIMDIKRRGGCDVLIGHTYDDEEPWEILMTLVTNILAPLNDWIGFVVVKIR